MRGDHQFHALGLPRAYTLENAFCAALGATCARALSHETLLGLFAKGIYIDAEALDILNERGYGEYTGFQTKGRFFRDSMEASVTHPLNPERPFIRNIRQSFWGGTATALEPTRPGAQILTRLVDYHDAELASCASGTFENTLGGRIIVAGYGAWVMFGYVPKYRQLHNIFRWLSHEQLDAEVTDCAVRTGVWARQRPDGGVNVAILNASLDPAINLPLRIRTAASATILMRNQKMDIELGISSREGEFAIFILPEIQDWELVYLATR